MRAFAAYSVSRSPPWKSISFHNPSSNCTLAVLGFIFRHEFLDSFNNNEKMPFDIIKSCREGYSVDAEKGDPCLPSGTKAARPWQAEAAFKEYGEAFEGRGWRTGIPSRVAFGWLLHLQKCMLDILNCKNNVISNILYR